MTTPYKQTLNILRDEIGYGARYYEARKDGSRRLKYFGRSISDDHIENIINHLSSEGLSGVYMHHVKNVHDIRSLVVEIPENIVSGNTVNVSVQNENSVNETGAMKSLSRNFMSRAKYVISAILAVTLTLVLLPFMYITSLVAPKRVTVSGTKIYVKNKYGMTIFGVGFGF